VDIERKVERPKAKREAVESGRKMMSTVRKAFESSGVLTIGGKLNEDLVEEVDEFIEVSVSAFITQIEHLAFNIQRLSKQSARALHLEDYGDILPASLTNIKVKARKFHLITS
jgi:hypothetical protein